MITVSRTAATNTDRPVEYSDELAQTILDRMADGETLEKICNDADMPEQGMVARWAINLDIDGFAGRLMRANELLGYRFAEKAIALAEDKDAGSANDRRLQIDTYKWFAGVAAPERFGKYAGMKPRGHAGLPGSNGGKPTGSSAPSVDEGDGGEDTPAHLQDLMASVAIQEPAEDGQVNGEPNSLVDGPE